ncbi:hypothetical protein EV363DRAFT_1453087 [Boletus edulis]|nr:hypothetical protein EV363DRAFT_1453087 [Boletus edulis]
MANRPKKRRQPLANPRSIARPHGNLNPCLRPDESQVNCSAEQPLDPTTADDPLSHHGLQNEIVVENPFEQGPHPQMYQPQAPLHSDPYSGALWASSSSSEPSSNHSFCLPSPSSPLGPLIRSEFPRSQPSHTNAYPNASWAPSFSSSSHSSSFPSESFQSQPSHTNPYPNASWAPSSSTSSHSLSFPSESFPSQPSHTNAYPDALWAPSFSSSPHSSIPSESFHIPSTSGRYLERSAMQPVAPSLLEHPHPLNTNDSHRLITRMPPSVYRNRDRAAPYIVPGLRFVPAYAPIRRDEQARGSVITTGVFRAGTETSITNQPPPNRRLPPVNSSPSHQAVPTTTATGSSTTANTTTSMLSPDKTQKILVRAWEKMRHIVFHVDAMPSRETCQAVLRDAMQDILGNLQPNAPMDEKTTSSIQAAAAATRKLFKDSARGVIHNAYNIRPALHGSPPDVEVVTKQTYVPWLLEEQRWLHNIDQVCIICTVAVYMTDAGLLYSDSKNCCNN